jgi:dTDP-4-dehydrorhamnose 3,5-epimerase-like enzyme
MEVKLIDFQKHGDERGMLVALEENKEIPFAIRRVYYMYDTAHGVRRGYHAHKQLEQILICVHGSCTIHLDNGTECEEVILDKPCMGLYIANNVWREMYDFSEDAVLMVLASQLYDEKDYIRDYQAFIDYIREDRVE